MIFTFSSFIGAFSGWIFFAIKRWALWDFPFLAGSKSFSKCDLDRVRLPITWAVVVVVSFCEIFCFVYIFKQKNKIVILNLIMCVLQGYVQCSYDSKFLLIFSHEHTKRNIWVRLMCFVGKNIRKRPIYYYFNTKNV